jgi:hypothetical protein
MADEMFEYLHMVIVQYYSNKKLAKNELVETLEALGFRVGFGLIEKFVKKNNNFKIILEKQYYILELHQTRRV